MKTRIRRAHPPCSPARRCAHRVLLRVHQDDAFAERVLETTLRRQQLSSADRALTTELVYGTLRRQRYLDFLLQRFLSQPLPKLPDTVQLSLRLGVYQLLETRVPDYAVVNDAVRLVERERNRSLRGVVNAVLRNVARKRDAGTLPQPEDHLTNPCEALAVRYSVPTWLMSAVAQERGLSDARAWAEATAQRPPVTLRVNSLRAQPAQVQQALLDAGHKSVIPAGLTVAHGVLELRGAGDVSQLPGYRQGWFSIQDISAQRVGWLLNPKGQDRVLDMCAAPGGKATHVAELQKDAGTVVAIDIHPGKAGTIARGAERLGLRSIRVITADAKSVEALKADVVTASGGPDMVLLDAPCSGTGTLRRHPELRTLSECRLQSLVQQQDALLDAAAKVVRAGGLVVYAVCAITYDEGPGRVEAFLGRHPEFAVEPVAPDEWPVPLTAEGYLRTWTDQHGGDGFFACRLRHQGNRQITGT